jgi:hypothetical protein
MQYKLIALDLDGTLTTSQKNVTERSRRAIQEAAARGVHIVLASGRPSVGIFPVAEVLDLKTIGGYILAYNGGEILDCRTGAQLISCTIPEEYYSDLAALARVYDDVTVLTYNHEGVITEDAQNPYVALEAKINRIPVTEVPDLAAAIEGPVNKMLAVGTHEHLRAIQRQLKDKYGDRLNVFFSETYFLEIVPPRIEKAASLERLLSCLGIKQEELIACGDGLNDITMIDYAGLGVAMANGQDAVKARADYITDTNDNDGVAKVIEKFILGMELVE